MMLRLGYVALNKTEGIAYAKRSWPRKIFWATASRRSFGAQSITRVRWGIICVARLAVKLRFKILRDANEALRKVLFSAT